MSAMTEQKPVLMLKDFLELDANSDSCDGFRSAPRCPDFTTIRCLLDAELGGRPRLTRSRSKTALTRISDAIHAVRLFSSPSPSSSKLPFSKKLRRILWRKRVEAEKHDTCGSEEEVSTAVVGDRRSLNFQSPVSRSFCSSSSSSSGDNEAGSSDFMLSSSRSSEFTREPQPSSATTASGGDDIPASPPPHVGGGRRDDKEEQGVQEMGCSGCHSPEKEEKEQLSPVSVMDFPDDEEEEEEEEEEIIISPRFQRTLDSIERTRQQLLQKIRRFESLAELEIDPLLDLDPCSDSSEEEEEEGPIGSSDHVAWDILCELKVRVSSGGVQEWKSRENLLLDFFAEGLSSLSCHDSSCSHVRWRRDVKMVCRRQMAAERLMAAAIEWVGGGRREEDVAMAEMREMERGGRWSWFVGEEEEEEEVVAEDVEVGVMWWLIEELVLDLVSSC